MLTLHPSPPQPFRADAARDELIRLWEGLNLEARRLIIANARAVAEVAGRVPPEAFRV